MLHSVRNHPISMRIVVGAAVGYAIGRVIGSVAIAQDNQQLAGCDEGNPQIRAQVAALIESLEDATPGSANQLAVTLSNGDQLHICARVLDRGAPSPQLGS
jgi:hypothetical protein